MCSDLKGEGPARVVHLSLVRNLTQELVTQSAVDDALHMTRAYGLESVGSRCHPVWRGCVQNRETGNFHFCISEFQPNNSRVASKLVHALVT